MKVSCICPTYNRPPRSQWLLEEAIESFLRQDYPDKELLVLNDCPGQQLLCDAPDVFVITVPRRFHSYGEKLNAAIALAQGDLIALWNDDDIMLPWRLSTSLERLAAPSIEQQYQRIGQMPIEEGQYVLRPHWREDYVRSTRNAIGISPYPV